MRFRSIAMKSLVILLAGCGPESSTPSADPTSVAGSEMGATPSTCPSPGDPSVHYVSTEPLGCAAARFGCQQNQTSFNDSCGCGCVD